jgi:hypothetical protein
MRPPEVGANAPAYLLDLCFIGAGGEPVDIEAGQAFIESSATT